MPTLKDKALLVKLFYQNDENSAAAIRAFRRLKNIRRGPMTPRALRDMMKKFERTGQLGILSGRGRHVVESASVEDVALAVVDATSQSPHGVVSVPTVSRAIDLPYTTVWRVMRRILGYFPYKIHSLHQLSDGDPDVRETFALQFLARMDVDAAWPWKILWTDEAHFHLNGQVNTHNCRIWATENPREIQQVPLHPAKVTVWCGFTATFVIGPYFFEEVTRRGFETCSVTGRRYQDMLTTFVIPELQQHGRLQDTIFMQDGAPPHILRGVQQVLRATFTDARVISRCFPTAWPPRSPDLTPCDFWLWGFLKDQVYREHPATMAHLKDAIIRHVRGISVDLLRSAVEHTAIRMERVVENHGTHIEHL